jgi:hypothetical protein
MIEIKKSISNILAVLQIGITLLLHNRVYFQLKDSVLHQNTSDNPAVVLYANFIIASIIIGAINSIFITVYFKNKSTKSIVIYLLFVVLFHISIIIASSISFIQWEIVLYGYIIIITTIVVFFTKLLRTRSDT